MNEFILLQFSQYKIIIKVNINHQSIVSPLACFLCLVDSLDRYLATYFALSFSHSLLHSLFDIDYGFLNSLSFTLFLISLNFSTYSTLSWTVSNYLSISFFLAIILTNFSFAFTKNGYPSTFSVFDYLGFIKWHIFICFIVFGWLIYNLV